MGNPLAQHWTLDPRIDFLNHGSFGACPKPVLEAQTELRARMERQPLQFLARDLEGLLDEARGDLARFIWADPDDLAFVPNATSGVNTVIRSLELEPGDELLTTDHAYNACRNALRWQERRGAKVVVAAVPWPIAGPSQVVDAVLGAVTARTRLALLDHVTSPTGIIFPVEEIVGRLQERGIDSLIDGAHAPGMMPLDLRGIGAAYFTGNCHKWLCAPKGAAFLYVRRDRQQRIRPLTISHGANAARTERSRFRLEFDWTGTDDPTPFLCIPHALRFLGSLFPGGWPDLIERNHALAVRGRKLLCEALRVEAPAPEEMLGSLASVPLPDAKGKMPLARGVFWHPLQRALLERHDIEVPVMPFPALPRQLIRISAQAYNSEDQFARLATALRSELQLA
ncbi:MAG: aminotransferase class V-fold PLP-dependent enzyme [Deltaproteobacteria bacterium]|nr:MAG: aminotransferase class V-fold PLP-dependent enzyme [Deltaproteobacteria bacterium]TMA74832.1 MAG: aminotransferase class V-fold PLP-dependent enzyme [Deltaproteobacteria bacterium]